MPQYTGTVKWFNNAKGYGFLGREDGPDVFIHFSSILLDGYKSLKEGESVSFDVVQGAQGMQADQVRRLDHTPAQLPDGSAAPLELLSEAEALPGQTV